MSVVNAASTAQVRYAATLALRIGKSVPSYSVGQPTLSQEGFQAFKRQFATELSAAVMSHQGAAPAPHQLRLLAAMARITGVQAPAVATRLQADDVAVKWFRSNPDSVVRLVGLLAAPAKSQPEQLALFTA